MSKYRKLALIGVLIVLAVIPAISLKFLTPETVRFESFADAASSGLIERGWIPTFLPEDAYNIIHSHDLDTSETVTEFSFRELFISRIDERLHSVSPLVGDRCKKDAAQIGWDFKNSELAKCFEIENNERRAILAIDESARRALYWEEIRRNRNGAP